MGSGRCQLGSRTVSVGYRGVGPSLGETCRREARHRVWYLRGLVLLTPEKVGVVTERASLGVVV